METDAAAVSPVCSVVRLDSPDGTTTVVHDFGGEGPVLLFVHATGLHGWVWKPVADLLVDRAHCVAVDLRGHGDTTVATGSQISWQGLGDDVLAAANYFGTGEVIGVGHSLGGAALATAELAAPGTFKRLYLYEPAIPVGMSDEERQSLARVSDHMVRVAGRRRARFASRHHALANYVAKPPMAYFQAAALDAYVSYGFSDVDDDPEAVQLKCTPQIEASIYDAVVHAPAPSVNDISCPITVATGADSDTFEHSAAQRLAAELAIAPVTLAGVGHFAPMESPKLFAASVATHCL
ncbi:alpha/beta hydrolase [Mycolicibacterium sp. CH28]|uniref:alpha/beta fold hydrolase n=1 Tax=Mycolicibacterium sp. CH28 TaxID=2512237 RepID=UPI0010820AC9|nr:alpha/beta hydrolase [Mycolicibacterium sp. CH28]TGD85195.1 alpha/beta hydrolase [Mycolicibacterium sp. CH28]